MKKFFESISEILKTVIIAFLIVLPIRYFLFQPFIVQGQSMEPNFESRDYLIVDEISYRFREPKRGEVIVFSFPQNPSQKHIKRIIGLPGETITIEQGKIIISKNSQTFVLNEKKYLSPNTHTQSQKIKTITLKEDEYFVLGDNRENSLDSRYWGPLPRKNIIGRVILRVFPFNAFAIIAPPQSIIETIQY
jgi:signal peptidase I